MVVLTPKTKAELESIIADGGDRLIVIDFYATWCGPCKMMGPKFEAELESIIADGGDRLIVIDFYATWCGPCKMMGPKFEKLSDEHKAAMFVKIDVDEQEEISDSYDINVLPTFILIKNKEKLVSFRIVLKQKHF
ncbi:unnamed protein product [Toxocara canis]|uniref:Thioredoxin n=1 Tax=Toxocara canis TaxID=6265 RepID=A0A183VH58_TOXCA|nr:unnamed protein product [Toxocara canis]